MESLSSSARTKLFTIHNRYGDMSSSRTQIRFLRYPISNVHSISLQFFKSGDSISSSSFSSKLQANVTNAEALSEVTHESKNVHVKFQLQKECLFGEHFFLVGDDPIIGLWDPASAIPLNWSDEHIWTVELDLPIGKSILFKFLLKGTTEEIFWQPGPDRIVETWETKNTIVVLEDWDNAEIQKITEEPSKDTIAEPRACDNEGVAVADNIIYLRDEPMVSENMESIIIENTTYPIEESSAKTNKEVFPEKKTKKEKKPSAKPKGSSLVAENIVGSPDKKLGSTQVADLVGYVGEPVLVPGLTPLPNMSTEAEDPGMPEPNENQEKEKQEVEGILNQEETTFAMIGNEPKEEQHEPPDCEAALDDAVQNDFQWGQKTLHKLLSALGISLDQT